MNSKTQKISGQGAHYILIAKLFFTLMGILIILWGLPYVFAKRIELYFEYNLILAKISLINMIFITGTIQAVSKFIAGGRYSKWLLIKGVYKLQLFLCLTIGIIFYFIAPYILDEKFQNLLLPLRISGLIPVFYGFYALNIGVINGQKRFGLQSAYDITFAFLRFIAIVGGSYVALHYGLIGFVGIDFSTISPIAAPYAMWAALAFLYTIISFINVVLRLHPSY